MIRRPAPSVLSAALAALALVSLSACSSSSDSTAGSATSPSASSSAAPSAGPASSASTSAPASGAVSSSAAIPSSVPGSSSPASSAVTSGPASGATSSGPATSAAATLCTPSQVTTKTAGKLTIATDEPAYEPWMIDDDPTSGKGYESAVAYAVAAKLGFAKNQVSWVRVKFNTAISPAPKNFDFDINQFSISADRAKVVDFSSGYYDVTQVVVTTKNSPIAKATTLAALKGAKLGAQIGTTSLDALDALGGQTPTVFQTNDAAVQSLKNGTIDGLVLDLPTAFYVAGAELTGGVILGQLPDTSGQPEQFGLLLAKGSPLTSCASQAVDALRADGTLAALTKQWLTNQGAPVLK